MKRRLLEAPYEVCMARALHYTRSYKETEGMDPALRNAHALQRTLSNQAIRIEPDERLAGSKTEKFLAAPLPVERGDFLRNLQLEMDILDRKLRPFRIAAEEEERFWREILPYWSGRTVRDRKARHWETAGLVDSPSGPMGLWRDRKKGLRYVKHLGRNRLRKLLGANLDAPFSWRRMRNLWELRYEFARNNPTAAIYCFDVQGHLCLGVEKAVEQGFGALIDRARERMERLAREAPDNARGAAFLQAVIISLQSAIAYAERFADRAEEMARSAADGIERARLKTIAQHCRHVPRYPPRGFHEALQAAWMTHAVGEIQYGAHEVFSVGRADRFLLPHYRRDIESGHLSLPEAVALLQEYFLKLSANVEPIPEAGMETNGVLGNSQHCLIIGGLTPDGEDATNALSRLILDAYAGLGGAVSQLCVRLHPDTPADFVEQAARMLPHAGGLAFYNDAAIVPALQADGLDLREARDYTIVGCVETSGNSNTHGCPGGHELVLPAVLWMAISRGLEPPPAPGQHGGLDCGDPASWKDFEAFCKAFRAQLADQIRTLVEATAGKDRAYREMLPAPYVSALMDDCIERARDITDGGARHDFTSLDLRGLATLVDSLMAIRKWVYRERQMNLPDLIGVLHADFRGHEPLRQRILTRTPRYGTGSEEAQEMALNVLEWVQTELDRYRNARGGRWRACYYSYGNHVIDGFMLGATPDGRLRGQPISNGVSPSNLTRLDGGPLEPMRTVAGFPPRQVSSGVSLNLRFSPRSFLADEKRRVWVDRLRTYFRMGGMHLQPNVVSTETLREAQQHPEQYRDLVVKVSGYSAYFTDLGKSIQEDIIARMEFD